jgi:membrane-bound serine protease (ClpP class)
MLGLPGEVLSWQDGRGRVRVRGEIWKARSEGGASFQKGAQVRIRDIDGLNLVVEPFGQDGRGE